MAAWSLNCANCKQNLTKFAIEDTLESYFFPAKPEFPEGGPIDFGSGGNALHY
jgi:hypothetical protein